MSISFSVFPSSRRASIRAIEMMGKKRSVSGGYIPEKVLIVGQFLAAKTGVTAGAVVQAFNADEVGDTFGYGSELHRQALWVFDALGGFSENVYCVAVAAPSGNAATGTVTITGDATTAGTLYFSLGGSLYAVNVTAGDTDDEIAAALVAAITADVSAAFTAAVGGTGSENIVTLTCKQLGVNGNEHYMMLNPSGASQSALNPSGPAVTFSGSGYFASGTGDCDVDVVFLDNGADKLGDTWYTLITCPYKDATNLGKYKAALNARFDPAVKRFAASVVGYTKLTYSQFFAVPATINSKFIAPVWDTRSLVPAHELSAALVGMVAASATSDPGRPFIGLPMSIPVKAGKNLTYAEYDALFRAGGGYFKLADSGELTIGDIGLSYRTTAGGASTEEWFDLVSVTRRQQKSYMIEQLLRGEPYIRGMVGSDDLITAKEYVIKPKQLVADLYRIVDEWGREGWSKNIDDIKATIAAEINSTNNSRIDAELTDDAAQALRIIAVKFAFLY